MTAVITGIGITCSCGTTNEQVKENIANGISGISKIDYFDTSDLTCDIAGNLDNDTWDEVIKISKDNKIDWSSSLSILTIERLLSNYGLIDYKERTGLSFGTCNGGINSLTEYYFNQKDTYQEYPPYVQGNDIRNWFKFKGPLYCFNSACAASANAIAYAAEMIENNEADIVIAGGSDPMSELVYAGFNSLRTFNSNNCKPYSEEYGLNLGESAAFFIIESKDKAISFGKKIYAEISGYGLTNDAYHPTAPDKEGTGISNAIKMALKQAQLLPEDIAYINSHGTGTKANDGAELNAFRLVFGDKLPLISSMKGYVGHNLGAAASTELAISLLGFEDHVIFPNYKLSNYRQECDDPRIMREAKYLSDLKDMYFINNNAAFGGQNVAVIFRVNLNDDYDTNIANNKNIQTLRKVYLNGWSRSTDHSCEDSSGNTTNFADVKPLKGLYPKLYKRRMNTLTQTSIIAAKNLVDNRTNADYGLIFGTPVGSLESTKKYIDSILKSGLGNASGAYFPELVLNSTTGHICQALGLKNYSSSISSGGDEDIKSLLIGKNAIEKGNAESLIVGAAQEDTDLGRKILNHQISNKANFIELSCTISPNSIAKITSSFSSKVGNLGDLKTYVINFMDKLETGFKNILLFNTSEQYETNSLIRILDELDIPVQVNDESDSYSVGNFENIENYFQHDAIIMSLSSLNELNLIGLKEVK